VAYDLAISEHGDLVVSGNRDLAGISGIDLIEQRIRMRLRMRRGEWLYDANSTLGSNLHQLTSMKPDTIASAAQQYVREALRGMTEISLDDVQVQMTNRDMTLIVFYQIEDDESDESSEIQELQVTLQAAVEAGG
jgi:phage gp46-like protein